MCFPDVGKGTSEEKTLTLKVQTYSGVVASNQNGPHVHADFLIGYSGVSGIFSVYKP